MINLLSELPGKGVLVVPVNNKHERRLVMFKWSVSASLEFRCETRPVEKYASDELFIVQIDRTIESKLPPVIGAYVRGIADSGQMEIASVSIDVNSDSYGVRVKFPPNHLWSVLGDKGFKAYDREVYDPYKEIWKGAAAEWLWTVYDLCQEGVFVRLWTPWCVHIHKSAALR